MPGPNTPYTKLSSEQVLQQSFDESNDRLRVDASVSATIGDIQINAEESDVAIKDRVTDNLLKINADGSIDVNVNIDAADGDNVAISDGANTLNINPDGSINVDGISTEAKQDVGNTSLSSIDSKLNSVSNRLIVDGSQVTQPISALSLPLPTGAATEAKQDTEIAKLTSIETILNSIDSGIPVTGPLTDSQLRASPVPVSVASLPLPTGAATEAKQDVGNTSLSSIDSKLNTLGQKLSAGSVPVVLASDQSAINVNLNNDPIKISGTIDGASGTEYGFVYNIRQQILASHDREQDITYADFGTKNQRITQIDYNSSTFTGFTARKTISYTLVGTKYRRDSINWSII